MELSYNAAPFVVNRMYFFIYVVLARYRTSLRGVKSIERCNINYVIYKVKNKV